MNKSIIRMSLAATALIAPATASAQDAETSAPAMTTTGPATESKPLALDQGWNKTWALQASLSNIFVQGNILSSPISGSVGGQYALSPDLAVRGGVTLSRDVQPAQVTRVVQTTGTDSITTYQVANPPGYTERDVVSLRGDLLKRLMKTPVAPYVGAGLQIGWSWTRQNYTDDKSVVDQRIELDNNTSSFNVTARGTLGAEWRVHENFGLFAEYALNVGIFNKDRLRNRTTIENTTGGTTSTSQTEQERDVDTWFNLSTGLAQGANLGLNIFF